MKRRTFLGTSAALLHGIIAKQAFGQPSVATHAALVIGIENTFGLPSLQSTIPQAEEVGELLAQQGYDVRLQTDQFLSPDEARNFLARIKNDVNNLLEFDSLRQLVVYFTGHGLWSASEGDQWLLPNALDDQDQAVHVRSLEQLAYTSGIMNIVLIADACRSPASGYNEQLVRGSGLLRTTDSDARVDLDRFFAARWSQPAYEVEVAASRFESVFTTALIHAFDEPPKDLLMEVDGRLVVPNRKLKGFLFEETDRVARNYNVLEEVSPFIQVNSEDSVYIVSQVESVSASSPESPDAIASMQMIPSDQQSFQEAFNNSSAAITYKSAVEHTLEYQESLQQRLLAIEERQNDIAPIEVVELDGASSGMAIYGLSAREILSSSSEDIVDLGVQSESTVSNSNGDQRAQIFGANLSGDNAAASTLVRFENGKCSILALLQGYVAHIFLGERGVDMIAYEPLPGSDAYWEYESERDRLRRIRALVSLSIKRGIFGLDGTFEEIAGVAYPFSSAGSTFGMKHGHV